MALEGEKVFNSAKDIKYLFQVSKQQSNYLVVVFSAFQPKNSDPAYNYIKTLQNLDINKLFILDDQGERGSYYLGENRVFDVEASVVSLITWVANQNNIPHGNIICCGSSKGGYASLYYGIKYGFGYVIAGAPQTKLGNYLSIAKEYPTMEFIAGVSSEDSISFLNNLLYDIVSNTKKKPDICIHVGSGDHHYKGHVIPFKEHLNKNGFECTLDIKDYQDHGEVRFFQALLVDKIIEIEPQLKNSLRILSVEVKRDQDTFVICTKSNKNVQYAWYMFKDNERISTHWYTLDSTCVFEAKGPGEYHFVAFIKDENEISILEKTQKYIVE